MLRESEHYLFLISPYFKLNQAIKAELSKHQQNKKFELIVIYGKNEDDKTKSLSDADMDFFKSFQNVTIGYHKRLHAKIYANECNCLLTSMNLHDFSMRENIEFGILTKSKPVDALLSLGKSLNLNFLPGSLDNEAFDFCEYVIEKSVIEFKKEVSKEKSFFGLFSKDGSAKIEIEQSRHGFCIRTGTKIAYNLERPYSAEAFQSWNQYKNPEYPEKFCHKCGTKNRTSMSKPIYLECWHKT